MRRGAVCAPLARAECGDDSGRNSTQRPPGLLPTSAFSTDDFAPTEPDARGTLGCPGNEKDNTARLFRWPPVQKNVTRVGPHNELRSILSFAHEP